MSKNSLFKVVKLPLGILISSAILTACANNHGNISKQEEAESITLIATKDFSAVEGQSQIWYVDDERKSLAVDAAKFKDQFAKVQTTFAGQSGSYKISLTALTETDGESQYQISVGDTQLAMMTNPETQVEFAPHIHQWQQDIAIKPGDIITVAFNSATNGKIPEGDTTAYSRGRWTKLEMLCTSGCN